MTWSRHRYAQWLLYALETQLFITLCAVPFLLSWGLPLSTVTIVGNILFAPILTMFLFLCAIVFFTQLMGIPNDWLMPLMHWYSDTWLWLLNQGSQKWLIYIPCPSGIILAGLMAATLFILCATRYTIYQRIGLWGVLLGLVVLGLPQQKLPDGSITIPVGTKEIKIMHREGRTVLIDEGVLQRAPDAWVRSTFMPAYTKQFGSAPLDYCVVTQPRVRTLKQLANLCRALKVRTIYLPAWANNAPVTWWQALGHLRNASRKHKTEVLPIGTEDIQLLEGESRITLHPHKPMVRVSGLLFPSVDVA